MSSEQRALPGRTLRRIGFTLVELMVVIVVIGLLAGVVTLSVRGYLLASKQNIARMEISKIVQALDTFYAAYDPSQGHQRREMFPN